VRTREDAAQIERQILQAVDKDDYEAVARLILREMGPPLLGFITRLIGAGAEDVFQETVIAAVDALRRGSFERKSSLTSYLYSIARNKAFDWRSSFWHKVFYRRSIPETHSDLGAKAAEEVDVSAAREDLDPEALLALLEPREKVVVGMRLEQVSFQEISKLLRISEGNAFQIHSRAIKKLRKLLQSKPEVGA
jgi:RNA polymerase sigma factor (sigma-70 family)